MPKDIASIMNIIKVLSEQSRPPGSPGSIKAITLITQTLNDLGFKISKHEGQITNWHMDGEPSLEILKPMKQSIKALPAILSPPTPKDGVSGIAEIEDNLNMLDSFPWERIAVIDNDIPVSYILSSEKDIRVQPIPEDVSKIPHVIIDYQDFRGILKNLISGEEVFLKIYNPSVIDGKSTLTNILSVNNNPIDNYILICAHHDSTFNSNGALDNASGVAVALHVAYLAQKFNWPCQFAFFDGEEINKAGSCNYVNSLSENELTKIKTVIEIDTVGAGKEIGFLCSKKLYNKFKNANLLEDKFDKFNINISPQKRISFSDVWPFMQKNVPVIRMLTRSPKGSGQGTDIIHSRMDTYDKIDPDTIQASCSAVTKLVKHLSEINFD
ncbi:MAG: M28 family peptidase [Bacteriovorax sp.]|nr:M28 family peptidase [Bacteriovorax sp.]